MSLDDAYALAQQVIDSLQDIDILRSLHPQDPYSPSGVRTRATPYSCLLFNDVPYCHRGNSNFENKVLPSF